MYQFSKETPEESEPEIWRLQQFLLEEAKKRLGDVENGKLVYQPKFATNLEDGPKIINSSNLNGAWACLSNNSKTYWPCALYELAHETIHLLNPLVGYTNYLEEGVAVAFAVEMSKTQTAHPMSPRDEHYSKAYELVKTLPDDIYTSVRKIRERCGSLGKANPYELEKLFPELDLQVIKELCSKCDFT